LASKLICASHCSHQPKLTVRNLRIARLNTVEGDNYILTQQTARWLLKQVAPLMKPRKDGAKPIELPETIKHLATIGQIDSEKCVATKREDFRNPAIQVHAVAHWAMRSLKDLYTAVEVNGKSLIGWSERTRPFCG
jgi:hypothetical protein